MLAGLGLADQPRLCTINAGEGVVEDEPDTGLLVSRNQPVTQILIGGPNRIYIVFYALLVLVLAIFIPFPRYAPLLKWLTLSLFTYVATVFAVVIAFGVIYNSARFALTERGRELASLRVLGFTRGEIA